MKSVKFLLFAGVITIMFSACKATSTASFRNYETQCLGVELDGSLTLKAWGTGRYWKDAADQAKKNAVRDVLFKGNFAGNGGCINRPLVPEVNAQEKYEAYFNAFFRDGGEYTKYISLKDERISSRAPRKSVARNSDQSVYEVVVRVLRADLQAKLIQDGILKP